MKIGVTHRRIDLEAGSCLRFLQKMGLVDDVIFGEDSWRELGEKVEKLYFVDCHPEGDVSYIEVEIYDHHFIEKILQEERVIELTSFDLLIFAKGTGDFDEEKLQKWARTVYLSEHRLDTGDMDIKRAMSRITYHTELTDRELYEQWFIPLMDSFFRGEKNIERGQKIIREAVSTFLQEYPDTPARKNLENWLTKINNPEKLDVKRNILHFLSYMEEAEAAEWLSLVLEALHKEQLAFREVLEDLEKDFENKIHMDFGGRYLILSYITSKRAFPVVLRYLISSQAPFLPSIVKEYFSQLPKPYFLLQVNPENLDFQIFTSAASENRLSRGGEAVKNMLAEMATELVKALRGEILVRRGINKNSWRNDVIKEWFNETKELVKIAKLLEATKPDIAEILKEAASKRLQEIMSGLEIHQILSAPFDLVGTHPLFFNKKDFPQLLWGSLTNVAQPADIFGRDAEQIRKTLVEVLKLVIDKEYFPPYCNPKDCLGCPLEFFYLDKCAYKRKLSSVHP